MKFSSTVDSLSRENRNLKLLLALFGFVSALLGLGVLALGDKQPVIVERSSHGFEIVTLTPLRRTASDLDQAVRLMTKARLSGDAVSPEVFLSDRQLALRSAEQSELSSRGMSQAIIVRSVQIADGTAVVDLDRMISVGEIRSAIKTKVSVVFEAVDPNELNPYGLRLAQLTPIEAAVDGKDGKQKERGK